MPVATIQDEIAKLQECMQRMISRRRGENGTIPGGQAHMFLLLWLPTEYLQMNRVKRSLHGSFCRRLAVNWVFDSVCLLICDLLTKRTTGHPLSNNS